MTRGEGGGHVPHRVPLPPAVPGQVRGEGGHDWGGARPPEGEGREGGET